MTADKPSGLGMSHAVGDDMTRWPTLIIALAGCATSPPPEPATGPRGLRASDHLELADQHAALAREHQSVPEETAPNTSTLPWVRSWDTSAAHAQAAQAHRAEAAALEADYEEACGTRTPSEVAMSPLVKYAIGGWPTTTGVILYLDASAGPPDRLLADMKCHRAWMMLAPSGMDDCPLDLPDLVVDARGDTDGITVSLIVRDPHLVEELHRRAQHEIETGAALRTSTAR
jgi:hypothetical protein